MPGYKETVQTFIRMKFFFGLIAQFGLVLGQVNREDFDEIAQVRFFEERRKNAVEINCLGQRTVYFEVSNLVALCRFLH